MVVVATAVARRTSLTSREVLRQIHDGRPLAEVQRLESDRRRTSLPLREARRR
jgi:hypothetical protein